MADRPPAREQLLNPGFGETVIDQHHHTAILLGADHPAGGLHDFLYPGKQVSVVITGTEDRRHALLQLLVHRVQLRQPQGSDKSADQPCARQVDAFAEGSTEYCKADPLTVRGELLEEGLTLPFVHAPRL